MRRRGYARGLQARGERARETEPASETLVRERERERERERTSRHQCAGRGEREQDVGRHAAAPESSELIRGR
jgi:hypothetical protein